ncbi:MAG: site-specific DNA-methyltransferase [Nitrosomonadaceae bacterium]|nr:site-specific DNA-methyltransferase [Nitrosomonadaceae bacterium]
MQSTRSNADNLKLYLVKNVASAKKIAKSLLKEIELEKAITFGLPEIDDRYHIWRVPLLNILNADKVGEVVIDAKTSLIQENKTTRKNVLESRLLNRSNTQSNKNKRIKEVYKASKLRNTVIFGDSTTALFDAPLGSVDLVFTSPPYYNARVEYSDYVTYQDYLLTLRKVIQGCHHVLADGRFFVINSSPVLIRRGSRNEASQRIAVPFDIHSVLIEEGFEFIDDIIWVKPEGAGWATGRGRRFAADRNPVQYKAVPVTEYVMVYRKKSTKLIDWYIRNLPPEIVSKSKIADGYEKTNIWKIHPSTDSKHPAVFPLTLASKVIQYYSFVNDVVLDPFAGTGTVALAAIKHNRRFALVEKDPTYLDVIKKSLSKQLGNGVDQIMWVNCEPPEPNSLF